MTLKYKITAKELQKLAESGVISQESCDKITILAKARIPSTKAAEIFSIEIDKNVKLSNVLAYGGEDFDQPYRWLAELTVKNDSLNLLGFCFRKGTLRGLFNFALYRIFYED